MLQEEDMDLKTFTKWQLWPVIARIECDFVRPTFIGNKLDIRTKIIEHGRSTFTFHQSVYHKDALVFEAKVKSVLINSKGRPTKLPPELSRLWAESDPGAGI